MSTTSLRNRIRAAESTQEVHALLEQGKNYQFASESTRNRWKIAAAVRVAELGCRKK